MGSTIFVIMMIIVVVVIYITATIVAANVASVTISYCGRIASIRRSHWVRKTFSYRVREDVSNVKKSFGITYLLVLYSYCIQLCITYLVPMVTYFETRGTIAITV